MAAEEDSEPRTDGRSRRPATILHIITRYVPYGATRNLQFVLEWERRRGYEPHIAVGGSVLFDVPQDVVVHRIPALRRGPMPVDDLQSYIQIRRLIGEVQPTVVQTHQSKSGILGRLAARGLAQAVIHTIHMPSFGEGYGRFSSTTFRALERTCARHTDFFVAVGEELKRMYVTAGVGREHQYTVIRSNIELSRFFSVRRLTPTEREGFRAQYRIPRDVRIILTAGLLEPRKRVDLVIRRLAPLLASGQAILAVAGDGSERHALEARVRATGLADSVAFLGFVPMFHQVLGVADLLVHASTSEGVPQVVLQAAAAGVPIVATEAVGLSEIPGQSVRTVDRGGVGLLRTCEEVLAAPRGPGPPIADFLPWSSDFISGQLAAFHDRVWSLVLQRDSPT